MKEALFYKKHTDYLECILCPHNCKIGNNKYGICKVRKNKNNILYAESYGKISAIAIDPIEKKPLYHFYPTKNILSVGSYGCNFKCKFCQNWEISQNIVFNYKILPNDLKSILNQNNSIGVAYTYNEPLISYEFLKETMPIIKEAGYKNVIVSNGFISEKPLEEIIKFIDAANIDLKNFSNEKYKSICNGALAPVLKTIKSLYENNVWIEITNLIVPDFSDNEKEFINIIDFISSISKDIPLHLSRYFPKYEYQKPSTPLKLLKKFFEIASKKLNYVYIGNTFIEKANSTFCSKCDTLLIERNGYNIKNYLIKDKCPKCNNTISGRFI